jgi:CheY-like chemotaxis protein
MSEALNSLSSVEEDFAISETTKIDEISKPPLILIVEDNELNINTLASYLAAKKYRPIVAQDGAAAIEVAQNYHPDLVLMDIQMPGMDGLEEIARIREHAELSGTPIIALTVLALEGDREKCLAAGANEYLTKPVKLRQLNETIQQFLDSALDSGYAYSDFLI